jgi:hypothetical protein
MMSEHKYNSLAQQYANGFPNRNTQRRHNAPNGERHEKGLVSADGKDVSGWEAYRRWLTRVQAPEKKRVPLDPGLYTWKGYRSWSEKIRRDWHTDD